MTISSQPHPLWTARLRQTLVGPRIFGAQQLAGIALCGFAVDVARSNGPATVASALAVFVTAALLLLSGRLASQSARWLVLAAPIFGVVLCLRTSPWLVALNLIAAWGLLVVAAGFSHRGRLFDTPLAAWARQGARVACDALDAVPLLQHTLRLHVRDTNAGTLRSVGLGLLLALPMVLLLGGLLLSGDAVFASVLSGVPADPAAVHIIAVVFGAFAALALMRAASGAVSDPGYPFPSVRPATTGVLLGALVLLYGVYATVTALAAIEGPGAFLDDPAAVSGWARDGFFQLLAVAALTLAILIALRALTRRAPGRADRWIKVSASIAVALTQMIVISAIARIWAYSEAYGLTMLRLYSALFAIWVAVVFAFLSLRFWNGPKSPEWLPMAAASAGLAILLALNIANPEAFVVQWNLNRKDEVARFDPAYLANLSDDALPTLQAGYQRLSPAEREVVRDTICTHHDARLWLGWNLSATRAANTRDSFCRS